jgi:hypothetical protein
LYSSQNNINLIIGHTATTGQKRNAYKISVRKSKRIRLLGRPKYEWEHKIKIYLKKNSE